MSFMDLKKARSARLAPSTQAVNVEPVTTTSTSDLNSCAGDVSKDNSEYYKAREDLYGDLGDSFEIRVSGIGRGIYVKQEATGPIKAGSLISNLRPIASVLSTRSITSYCSYCCSKENAAALKRCTACKVVWYDSTTCQSKDWRVHKYECTALRKWAEGARQAGRGSANSDAILVPSDAVRALGRILWNIELSGPSSSLAEEVQQMQSHRLSLDSKSTMHSRLILLGQSLAKYLNVDLSQSSKWGISCSADLVDFLSKFTTNAFTLSTPLLSPIGVFVSPLGALFNHSCAPNAVVVPPETELSVPPQLTIVALRDIQPGEQVHTSYIDITLPVWQRRQKLKEMYFFDCNCTACISPDVDPRQSFLCRKCSALTLYGDDADATATQQAGRPITCVQCRETLASDETEFRHAIKAARDVHSKASGLQITDPLTALQFTSFALSSLHRFPLHLSSNPLLALMRLHLPLLYHQISLQSSSEAASLAEQTGRDAAVDEACRWCARCVAGVSGILAHGHPIRGIALAEFGKLLCVDVGPSTEPTGDGEEPPLPRGAPRLQLAAQVLFRAREELTIGFSQAKGGGVVGKEVEEILRKREHEINVWRKHRRVA